MCISLSALVLLMSLPCIESKRRAAGVPLHIEEQKTRTLAGWPLLGRELGGGPLPWSPAPAVLISHDQNVGLMSWVVRALLDWR